MEKSMTNGLTNDEMAELKFAKAIYGTEAFEENKMIKYGNRTLVGWCLVGSDTIEELESKFDDKDIYLMFKQSQF